MRAIACRPASLSVAILLTAFVGAPLSASAEDKPEQGVGSVVDQLRLGVYAHDLAFLGSSKETNAPDINLEVLFRSPDWLDWLGSPNPNLGGSINTNGGTSLAHAGLAWNHVFYEWLFVEGSFGMAIHDGGLQENVNTNARAFGCRWAFHESLSLGVKLAEHHYVMATAEHMSNASLCDENDGITNAGLRYAYQF